MEYVDIGKEATVLHPAMAKGSGTITKNEKNKKKTHMHVLPGHTNISKFFGSLLCTDIEKRLINGNTNCRESGMLC